MDANNAGEGDPATNEQSTQYGNAEEETRTWQDHPEEEEILRQVEFYFSDENLLTDDYLKGKMNGNANEPVSLKSICGFPKMRRFKPLGAVFKVLERSTTLDTLPKRMIRRKVPFCWPDSGDEDSEVEALRREKALRSAKINETRRNPDKFVTGPKTGGQKGPTGAMAKPTGFEEYYADAPVTPAEYADERRLYDPDESFVERIETAIRRFASRRKFHQQYKAVFDSFLKFGGVETDPAPFGGGLTKQDMAGMTKTEIAIAKCNYTVNPDVSNGDDFVIDFEAVAKGYFSSHLGMTVRPWEQQFATTVIANFYKYLLHHDVVSRTQEPELVADIYRALDICKAAERELPLAAQAGLNLPGDFNVAVSVLTDGHHAGLWIGDSEWAAAEMADSTWNTSGWGGSGRPSGMEAKKARVVAATGLACYADEQFWSTLLSLKKDWHEHLHILEETYRQGLEIVKIEPAGRKERRIYETKNMHDESYSSSPTTEGEVAKKVVLEPLGKVTCREWTYEDFVPRDLPASYVKPPPRDIEFLVEDELHGYLFPGMKLEANVRRVGIGPGACKCEGCEAEAKRQPEKEAPSFWQMDTVVGAYCSFFTFLKNELVTKPWKKPRFFEDEKEDQKADEKVREEGGGGEAGADDDFDDD